VSLYKSRKDWTIEKHHRYQSIENQAIPDKIWLSRMAFKSLMLADLPAIQILDDSVQMQP